MKNLGKPIEKMGKNLGKPTEKMVKNLGKPIGRMVKNLGKPRENGGTMGRVEDVLEFLLGCLLSL